MELLRKSLKHPLGPTGEPGSNPGMGLNRNEHLLRGHKMRDVDYDKKKFTKDAYGNLIPKKQKRKAKK